MRATADLYVGLSEIDGKVGHLDAAKQHLQVAAALAEGATATESRLPVVHRDAGQVAAAEGDPQRAIDLLPGGQRRYRPGFFPDVRPIPAMKARIWIAQGKLAEAAGWARDRGVTVTDDASYLSEYDHLTLVRLLIAQHRAGPDLGAMYQAAGLLDRLLDAAEPRAAPEACWRSACCRP